MDTDTQRITKEIARKGYIRPGQTGGNWGEVYKKIQIQSWGRYILYVGEDTIEFTARDDEAALQYITDTFIPGTEYELFERVCQYRKIN